MANFMAGAISMGYFACALFFLRYWYVTKDRLFGAFAAAFALLCAQRLLSVLATDLLTTPLLPQIVRLAAFLLIIVAIADKNGARVRA